MKKIISLVLILTLTLSVGLFAGCTGENGANKIFKCTQSATNLSVTAGASRDEALSNLSFELPETVTGPKWDAEQGKNVQSALGWAGTKTYSECRELGMAVHGFSSEAGKTGVITFTLYGYTATVEFTVTGGTAGGG